MAYNTFPSYNAYPAYPTNSYQQQYSQAMQPNQYMMNQNSNSYAAQQQPIGIVWVDGEVGAKAYQLPSGWPANAPMPLWDTNDTVIYLKSINPMGMPNPLQKIHYRMEEQEQQSGMMPMRSAAPALMSGEEAHNYVTREDLELQPNDISLTNEMMKLFKSGVI